MQLQTIGCYSDALDYILFTVLIFKNSSSYKYNDNETDYGFIEKPDQC